MKRCEWAQHESLIGYHDTEWCVPVHDDKKLFEMLILEGAQAGLSWLTILKRRKNYQKAFDNFDIKKIAAYTKRDFNRLMRNEGIIRNRLKIQATITNAKKFIEIQKQFGSFDKYIWSFVNNKVIKNSFKTLKDYPSSTSLSDAMSIDLKKRGFTFVGSTIMYAFMQAIGMVNDHQIDCFRYDQV